jgi:hypothetical protein
MRSGFARCFAKKRWKVKHGTKNLRMVYKSVSAPTDNNRACHKWQDLNKDQLDLSYNACDMTFFRRSTILL